MIKKFVCTMLGSMRLKQCLVILFALLEISLLGQTNLRNFDYSKADSIALNFPKQKYKSFTEIIFPLTDSLKTDQEKFRAIFRWITDNIEYSYSNRSTNPDRVIKKGKAVCGGYASLLRIMCGTIGIKCPVITGYTKTTISDINKKYKRTDHAWNAVKLNDKWYLVDATWASGYLDERTRKFVKQYDNTYYFTEPKYFYSKHLPKDKSYFFDEPVIKLKNFKKDPVLHSGFKKNEILKLKPSKGIIKRGMNGSLKFTLQSGIPIYSAIISLNNGRLTYEPDYSIKKGKYIFKQKFKKPGNYAMTIFINERAVATYKLKIKKYWL